MKPANKKRKHDVILTEQLESLVKAVDPSMSQTKLSDFFMQVQALVAVSKLRKVTIAASTITDLEQVIQLTGIKYQYGVETYYWKLLDDPEKTDVQHACSWLETALHQFRNSKVWHSNSAEALCRTSIDMILFDRLSLKQDVAGARNLVIKGEKAITTACVGKAREISGIADYVLGYCFDPAHGSTSNLESTFIVVEAKKGTTFSKGRAQVAAYLAGIQQQRRLASKIVFYVYGVVTDGITFEFLRLDHGLCLQISRQYLTTAADDRHEVYRYLDAIIDAAIKSSPHTTPVKTFPKDHATWSVKVERKLFDVPQEVLHHLPENWEDYLDTCSDDDYEDHWLITRSETPTRSNITLLPKQNPESTVNGLKKSSEESLLAVMG